MRGLVARIDLDECVARIEREIADLPEYSGFVAGSEDLGDRGITGIRWNLEIFLDWAVEGGRPDAAGLDRLRELVAARAAEGRPPEEGLIVYRRAMRAAWDAVLDTADERERALLGASVDVMFEWLDIVSVVFEQMYAEEKDALISPDERRARWLFEQILDSTGSTQDGQRLAETLGFELAERYRPLVATIPEGSAVKHLKLAATLRERPILAIYEGRFVVGVAHEPVEPGEVDLGAAILICGAGPEPVEDLDLALDELRTVAAIASGAGASGLVDPEPYLPELLLGRSPRIARRIEERVFGPLANAGRPELIETLKQLATNRFEQAAAASALVIHRNTLAQRIDRIEALTGLDLTDPDTRGTIWLATRYRTSYVHDAQSD